MRNYHLRIALVAALRLLRFMDGLVGFVERGFLRASKLETKEDCRSITSFLSPKAEQTTLQICVQPISGVIYVVDLNDIPEYDWVLYRKLIAEAIPRAPRWLGVVKREVCSDGVLLAKRVIEVSKHEETEDLLNSLIRLCYVSEEGWVQ